MIKKFKNFIFLGSPGSGKGTQALNLIKETSLVHLSTGDLLRKEIEEKSELGLKLKNIIDAGQLVDDKTVAELLKKNCDLKSKSFIFDGFPRTLAQAEILSEDVLANFGHVAVYFEMPEDVIVSRLVHRRICQKCNAIYNIKTKPPKNDGYCDNCESEKLFHRSDDKEEVIRERVKVYNENIGPVLDFYRNKDLLKVIDANRENRLILDELLGFLDN